MPAPRINPTPPVSALYGAPMGRAAHNTYTDKHDRTYEITIAEGAPPCRLVRVHIDRGGYDSGGAYWGLGEPLYYYATFAGDIDGFVRGRTREAAKEAVRKLHPHARFYR
jgi:hypothetical protein